MRKSLCLAALVLLSMFAATVAVESPVQAGSLSPLVPLSFCPGTWCNFDSDCYAACPGGEGSSYCNRLQHKCYPY
jgi:hypothetical protein